MLQELDHELLVVVVCPGVRHSFSILFFVECKLCLEKVQEIFKQKINVYISSDIFR